MFDIYDDRGALLKHYFPNDKDLPKFVVDGLGKFSQGQKLASDDFALSIPLQTGIKNIYPMANDALTAVSCLYFDHTHQSLPPALQKKAAANLLEACTRFNVEPSEKVAELGSGYQVEAPAATTLKKPFQSQGIDGSQMFPLSTPEQFKTASDLFDKIITKLHPEQRRSFSQALIQKAAEFNTKAPTSAQRWGGDGTSRVAVLDALEKRAQFMSEDQLTLLRKATDTILDMHADKVAEILYSMDEDLGIEALWGTKVPDPRALYELVTSTPSVKIAGLEMPVDAWNSACDSGVLDAFDDNLKSALRRHPELLNQYEGHPVQEHILGGLESLGYITRG